MLPSSILIIAKPDISSMNEAFTLINFCTLGFRMMCSFRKMGRDLFRNLKQQSCEFVTSFNLNTFLIPNIRSTFSWISETRVYISDQCMCTSTITGIVNNTLTTDHFLPEFSVSLMQISVMNGVIYSACSKIIT